MICALGMPAFAQSLSAFGLPAAQLMEKNAIMKIAFFIPLQIPN